MVRRDSYFEDFRETTTERGWSEEQQMFVGRIAVNGHGGSEHLMRIVEAVFEIEDGIKAQKDYDSVFNPDQHVFTPAEFRQTQRYKLADAGWDENGKFLGNPEDRDL